MFVVALHERHENSGTHYSYVTLAERDAQRYYEQTSCEFLPVEFYSLARAIAAGEKWHQRMIAGPYSAIRFLQT